MERTGAGRNPLRQPIRVSAGPIGDYGGRAALFVGGAALIVGGSTFSEQGSILMLPIAGAAYLMGKTMKRHEWVDTVVPGPGDPDALGVPGPGGSVPPGSAFPGTRGLYRDPFAAGALEWLFPTLGYGYAGDWKRGLPSGALRVAGLAMVLTDLSLEPGQTEGVECDDGCAAGILLYTGATLYAIIDASRTAGRFGLEPGGASSDFAEGPTLRDGRLGMAGRLYR